MILRLIPVVILLGEALCFAQHATPLVPMNAATEAHLQNEIPTLMEKSGVPGLSIAVIRDGKTVWAASYGVRNAETRKPVTEGTLFNVGSLSKPVFAYGVLKLVDAGKLKLDESLAPYLPKESIAGDSRFNQITARFVLSHRTGFPNWPADGKPLTIHFTPGERFSYSGSGMVLLQRSVEKITGKPLNDYMQEAVFGPLGMKHSSYVWNPAFENEVAAGHDIGGTPADLFKPDQANAAASLETTAEDYAIFLDAILQEKGYSPPHCEKWRTRRSQWTPAVQTASKVRPRASCPRRSSGGWDLASRRRRKASPCGTGATMAYSRHSLWLGLRPRLAWFT